jgi:predicted molibdopterin-dependent oxidoreductase YjgC
METFTIIANGKELEGQPGQTVLEVCQSGGVHIPTLCHHPKLQPFGGCRLCVVEIEGVRGLPAACTTPATPGMKVSTHTDVLHRARRTILELLLANGDHDCLMCDANGQCELQALVYEHGIEQRPEAEPFTRRPLDDSNAMILRDLNKCVLCNRCVRACMDHQVNGVIDVAGRGSESVIATFNDMPLGDSECVFCGECVQVCPTGALIEKQARFGSQPWDLKRVQTTCTYCGVGCQLELNVKDNTVVKVTSNHELEGPNGGSLCVKGRFGTDFIGHPERLTHPLIRENGRLREADWPEAMSFVAQKLTQIKTEHGPDAIAFFTSARATNEENYLINKLSRAAVGTNNIDHCARL